MAHGFSAATTDMIQRAAEVSKSTVYSYYPTKEELFVAVIEAECRTFTDSIQGIKFRPGKLGETLAELARAYLNIVLSETALSLLRVIIAEAPRFPEQARAFYLAGPSVIASMVAEILGSAAASGEVDLTECGRLGAADLFANMVRGGPQFQCLLHPNTSPSAAQIDQWVAMVVTTFMRAYGRE
ncbi:transcriptional regulator, TetR family [Paraburkholderia steynii]|uniref:Transcriptional regulator, TetR family n=2 Tax=Paraburkholderia steynii TaxID=1245441 RepID=A0A7Z7BE04_9BURK|nr:transcriptional regulator, TetR family [Paraburkholderia steynii]